MNPLITIVIPVKNGDAWLSNLFEQLSRQTIYDKCEILVIDSGSTDDSLEICRKHNVRFHQIDPASFNHGLTRNLGVHLSKGKFVFMTVQDAVPEKPDFLERLLHCMDDQQVIAVCGLQIVPVLKETSPFNWHRPVSAPEVHCYQFSSAAEFDRLPPAEKKNICRWDDVCALYRKDMLVKLPFRELVFGEDMAWCRDALRAGYKICYQPAAKVLHYHLEKDDYLYRRALAEIFTAYKLFGYIPERGNTLLAAMKATKLLLKERRVSFFQKFYWFFREMRSLQTVNRTIQHFNRYQKMGEEQLVSFHNRICGQPPSAPKLSL